MAKADDSELDPAPPDLTALYGELKAAAKAALRRSPPSNRDGTLGPTALVHETWLRIDKTGRELGPDYVRYAARVMRTVLVDYARKKGSLKRGGDRSRVPLTGALERSASAPGGVPDWLEVDLALKRLEETEDDLAAVAEVRFFGGLSDEETAGALGVDIAHVQEARRRMTVSTPPNET